MRDITVTSFPASSFTGMLRPSIAKAADRLASQGQFGSGLHSGSTESAHLVLQNFFGAAALRGECAVGVFLDVATAFPSMARRLVIPTVANDEMWLRIVRAAGFTDWETQEIYSEAVDIVKWGSCRSIETYSCHGSSDARPQLDF